MQTQIRSPKPPHLTHNASERIEVVQPHSRPLSDTGAGDRDTTGGRKDGRQERVEQEPGNEVPRVLDDVGDESDRHTEGRSP